MSTISGLQGSGGVPVGKLGANDAHSRACRHAATPCMLSFVRDGDQCWFLISAAGPGLAIPAIDREHVRRTTSFRRPLSIRSSGKWARRCVTQGDPRKAGRTASAASPPTAATFVVARDDGRILGRRRPSRPSSPDSETPGPLVVEDSLPARHPVHAVDTAGPQPRRRLEPGPVVEFWAGGTPWPFFCRDGKAQQDVEIVFLDAELSAAGGPEAFVP